MEWKTTEFVIQFLDERILIMKSKENLNSATKEGAVECLEKMRELCNSNSNTKAIITHVGSLYVKKEVMRVFSDEPSHKTVTCTALVSPSFLAKNMATIALKMRARFTKDDVSKEVFSTEGEAIEWVRSVLSTKS